MDDRQAEHRKGERRDDRRRSGERRKPEEVTYVETKADQDRFEELVREEQEEGDWNEQAFQNAVERRLEGEAPKDPPTSGKP